MKNPSAQPGALPSGLDFALYADGDSWRQRLNFAQRLITNATGGIYYVGVYNSGEDIVETASFTLFASWDDGTLPLCPWECFLPQGMCVLTGVCKCTSGTPHQQHKLSQPTEQPRRIERSNIDQNGHIAIKPCAE